MGENTQERTTRNKLQKVGYRGAPEPAPTPAPGAEREAQATNSKPGD